MFQAQVNVWSTYELQGGWLRGVGLGLARDTTRTSLAICWTHFPFAYGLMDASIFYRRGPLVGR